MIVLFFGSGFSGDARCSETWITSLFWVCKGHKTDHKTLSKMLILLPSWDIIQFLSVFSVKMTRFCKSSPTYRPRPEVQCTATQLPGSSLNISCSRLSQSSTTCSGGPEPSSNGQSCSRDLFSLACLPWLMHGNFNPIEQKRPSHPSIFIWQHFNSTWTCIDILQMLACCIEILFEMSSVGVSGLIFSFCHEVATLMY